MIGSLEKVTIGPQAGREARVLAYLFPQRADFIRAVGKEAGDSRVWAGIHYEMDNQSGITLGKAVAGKLIEQRLSDGAD